MALKAKAFDHLNLEYHHDISNYLHIFSTRTLYIKLYIYIYISHCTNRNQEAMNDFDTISVRRLAIDRRLQFFGGDALPCDSSHPVFTTAIGEAWTVICMPYVKTMEHLCLAKV